RGELLDDALRRDVAADEDRLRPRCADLLGGLRRGTVVPHVAEDDVARAVASKPERDRLADPPCPAGDEHRPARGGHSSGNSGSYAGAALGRLPQPIRPRDSFGLSSAFEEANARRSRRSILSSP